MSVLIGILGGFCFMVGLWWHNLFLIMLAILLWLLANVLDYLFPPKDLL